MTSSSTRELPAIGVSARRVDATDKVTGAALYPADLRRRNFLHARVVFTNQPHARLLRLDVRPALAIPGVVEVVTAADVPVNEYGLVFRDQPVLIGPNEIGSGPVASGDSGRARVAGDVSRWEADHLALVVAESVEAATAGAEAIVAE